MNMNKIIIFVSIFISLFLITNVNVYAANVNNSGVRSCNEYDKAGCDVNRRCKWDVGSNNCIDAYLADDPCSDKNILKVLNFLGYILLIAKIAVPLIIIIMGTFDLFKSVVDKDEKSLSKQLKILGVRVIAGIFIFYIPTLIYALFGISSDLNIVEEAKYKGCVDCVLKPTECNLGN